jgi:hypothetical protein
VVINGAHVLIYSTDAGADRAFFKDVLGLRSVDVGEGWLIFALPPSEVALHPGEGDFVQEHDGHKLLGAVLYLMCADLQKTIATLQDKKVRCSKITEAPWGFATTVALPSGGEIGLYQPTHRTAHDLERS